MAIIKSEVTQSCSTLWPMDCSLPGSSTHGISYQVAISISRGSSPPRDQTGVSHIASRRFTVWATRGSLIADNKCWWGCGETGHLTRCSWDHKTVQLLCKAIWQSFKPLNIELTHVPAIPLLGIYPREISTYIHTKTSRQVFTAAYSQ